MEYLMWATEKKYSPESDEQEFLKTVSYVYFFSNPFQEKKYENIYKSSERRSKYQWILSISTLIHD